jgi:hypothetical protein
VASAFSFLIDDLKAVRKLTLSSAREGHLALGLPEGEEPGSITIDLAPLLGLEGAPHRLLTLANLDAVAFFRMSESGSKLTKAKQVEGWPAHLITDITLLCAMHQAPSIEGTGLRLLDLYEVIVSRAPLRPLWLYLIERVGRTYPALVRPELALEILYVDQRYEQLLAGLEPTLPTPEEVADVVQESGLLPMEGRDPNASAP